MDSTKMWMVWQWINYYSGFRVMREWSDRDEEMTIDPRVPKSTKKLQTWKYEYRWTNRRAYLIESTQYGWLTVPSHLDQAWI